MSFSACLYAVVLRLAFQSCIRTTAEKHPPWLDAGVQGMNLFGKTYECQVCLNPPSICRFRGRLGRSKGCWFVRQCSCPNGWVGAHCEQESQCKNSPCYNGGICQDASGLNSEDYSCQCPPGFSGSRCQSHSSVCGACCDGMKNCTNGTSTVCSDEAPAEQVRFVLAVCPWRFLGPERNTRCAISAELRAPGLNAIRHARMGEIVLI